MKKNVLLIIFLCLSSVFFAIAPKKVPPEEYSWILLEAAQVDFDGGKFGEALNLALKAKENRRLESTYEYAVLEKAITPRQVTRVGNHFEDVILILKERDETEAVQIINYYIDLYGTARFDESIKNLAEWIRQKEVYPEADYLIGKIYQLEGEYVTAAKYYDSAFKNSLFLDVPEQKINILYSQAKLAEDMGDMKQCEEYLTLIIHNDSHFTDRVLLDSFTRTVNTDKPESINNFFLLYRAESRLTLNALHELCDIYENQKQKKRALECTCLGAVEGFTHIHKSLEERDSDYKYDTFRKFLSDCAEYPDIIRWASDNHVWEFFFEMADRAGSSGSLVFASKMFEDLANACPDSYWKAKALNRLVK